MKANMPKYLSEKQRIEVKAYIEAEAQYRLQQMIHRLHDIDLMLSIATLQDKFGFGADRTQRFVDGYMAIASTYGDKYDTALLEALRRHTGVTLEGGD